METWSCTPAFAVELVVGEDGYTGFQPSFPQLEDVCLQALEQCVSAAGAIPRVGSTTGKGRRRVIMHWQLSMTVTCSHNLWPPGLMNQPGIPNAPSLCIPWIEAPDTGHKVSRSCSKVYNLGMHNDVLMRMMMCRCSQQSNHPMHDLGGQLSTSSTASCLQHTAYQPNTSFAAGQQL